MSTPNITGSVEATLDGVVGRAEGMHVESGPGYVALLDILEFSELVLRDDYHEYVSTVSAAIARQEGPEDLRYILFSDTVVISILGEKEAFKELLRATSNLFDALLKKDLAVRGAIAYGEFDRSLTTRGTVVVGRPILEAHEYEQKQDWVGVMLCPSVLRRDPELLGHCRSMPSHVGGEDGSAYMSKISWPRFLRAIEDIPLRDGSAEAKHDGVAVVPLAQDVKIPIEAKRSLKEALSALDRMKMCAPGPAAQRKFSRARMFLKATMDKWPNLK